MKKLIVIALALISQQVFAQLDTLKFPLQTDTLKNISTQVDSLKQKLTFGTDSLTGKFTAKTDSLKSNVNQTVASVDNKIDSIQSGFKHSVDSIQQSYQKVKSRIDSLGGRYQRTIDSLNNLNLPTDKYTRKLDSLNSSLQQIQSKTTEKINVLKGKATEKIKSLELPPELESKVSSVTSSINEVKLPGVDTNLGDALNMNKLDLPNIDGVKLDGLPEVNGIKTDGLPDVDGVKIDGMPDIKGAGELNQLSDITQKAGDYQDDLGEITSGNLDQVNDLPKAAEDQVTKLDEVKALQEQTGKLPANPTMSEEEVKQQLKEQAKQVAVDHFAGQQEKLKAAMDKIAKYKQKYSEVQSLKDLPKKIPNAMKGKPFIERVVPGITLQFQQKNDWLLDVSGSFGYRFSGRITAGLGWNQRFAYDNNRRHFNADARIYGPRTYGEFKLKKGFSVRGEVEYMNTYVPPKFRPATADLGHREWVPGIFTGLKKDYKFLKKVRGNVQILYSLYNPDYKSPYVDRLNMRIGFEFPQKKKKKTSEVKK